MSNTELINVLLSKWETEINSLSQDTLSSIIQEMLSHHKEMIKDKQYIQNLYNYRWQEPDANWRIRTKIDMMYEVLKSN